MSASFKNDIVLQNYIKRTAVAQQLRRQTHQVEKVVAGGTEVGEENQVYHTFISGACCDEIIF